jgi:uncharacterized surface protein with fasciclin (FAS1) repeats
LKKNLTNLRFYLDNTSTYCYILLTFDEKITWRNEMRKILLTFALLIAAASLTFAGGSKDREAEPDMKSIVEIAVEDGRFTTLVTALEAADLVGTLNGEGPYTVFAPTDDAFSQLPDGTVEALLGDIPTLRNILLYHVVPGSVMASEVVSLDSADTASGEMVRITVDENKVMINDAQVIITDIKASNGVIHVIDRVILPPAA